MRALQLNTDAATIVDAAREHGLLVNATAQRVVRLLPALNIETADIDRAVDILDDVLSAAGSETAQ
jgi:acetylornithine aminotransferase